MHRGLSHHFKHFTVDATILSGGKEYQFTDEDRLFVKLRSKTKTGRSFLPPGGCNAMKPFPQMTNTGLDDGQCGMSL